MARPQSKVCRPAAEHDSGVESHILSGVRIGNGALVSAGAILALDVPAYAIVVGNPVKLIPQRFFPDHIEALERIRW